MISFSQSSSTVIVGSSIELPLGSSSAAVLEAALRGDNSIRQLPPEYNHCATRMGSLFAKDYWEPMPGTVDRATWLSYTSTKDNDAVEITSLLRIFGERLQQIPLWSTKAYVGHTMGASGLVSLVLGMEILNHKQLPGLVATKTSASEQNFRVNTRSHELTSAGHFVVSSFGFGGYNASISVEKIP